MEESGINLEECNLSLEFRKHSMT
uniref:Uncharacterized protein n=1 Tax=Arundo donax TaxID=35708 RepID=A0A0A9HE06_ARUDO